MKSNKMNTKNFTLMVLIILVSFAIVGISYGQSATGVKLSVPEPNSLLLLLTGFVGGLVRLVRKKFVQFKKAFDIVFAVMCMVVSAPVVGFIALYIKIVSPGPAFFKQVRVGEKGKLFNIYKLRTMRLDAEKSGQKWADENDPRLIKGGKILRKMHVDELPQLINVLKGEMSIIGPRPEIPVFVDSLSKEIVDYKKRLQIKPGITGLAQVWHKYDETIHDVRKKVKYDILYIKKMCFLVDLRILYRTVIVAATGKGAR